MSAPLKGTTLRLVMPKDSTGRILAVLGPPAKIESRDVVLTAGRMTTDEIVSTIKDCARFRDELFHTIRQLGLTRDARVSGLEARNYANTLAEARKQLDEEKTRHLELQSRIEDLERRIDEARKQISRISEIVQAGFSSADVVFAKGEFNRVLGKMPLRKLGDAQHSLQKLLGDQVVLAPGNRTRDWVYILAAAPEEKTSQVLQTLLLYDFVQTDIPRSEEPDLKIAQSTLEARVKELTQELDASRDEMKSFQNEAGESLNRLTDNIQDSLIQLQAVLKMGEGSKASQAFAQLPKAPTPKILSALSTQGALFETE